MPPPGGLLATVVITAITYLSGSLLGLTDELGEAWANVTPGQAALLIGLLTYGTHTGPKAWRVLRGACARLPRRPRA